MNYNKADYNQYITSPLKENKPKEMKKINTETKPVQMYHDYKIHFLVDEIHYGLNHPVKLTKSLYENLSAIIHKEDVVSLNKILTKINSELSCKETIYINNRKTRFHDAFQSIEYQDKEIWFVNIVIQGYKVDINDKMTPIWRIKSARIA